MYFNSKKKKTTVNNNINFTIKIIIINPSKRLIRAVKESTITIIIIIII